MSSATHTEGLQVELLERARVISGGRLMAMHTDMAAAPAVLAGYLGLRRANSEHGRLDPAVRAAIMLSVAVIDESDYAVALAELVGRGAGLDHEQLAELRSGDVADEKLDALLAVIREATANSGRVAPAIRQRALAAGWDSTDLAEAFAYLAITLFMDYFTNYAETPLDVSQPAGVAAVDGLEIVSW
jgi:alkylhydroperoxidase family enzyme